MRYIARPEVTQLDGGIIRYIWTGSVDDDYTLDSELEEVWVTEEEHRQITSNARYATINEDGTITIDTGKKERRIASNVAKRYLSEGDWKVIRELERLYLSGTDLNVEREALRNSVTHED